MIERTIVLSPDEWEPPKVDPIGRVPKELWEAAKAASSYGEARIMLLSYSPHLGQGYGTDDNSKRTFRFYLSGKKTVTIDITHEQDIEAYSEEDARQQLDEMAWEDFPWREGREEEEIEDLDVDDHKEL